MDDERAEALAQQVEQSGEITHRFFFSESQLQPSALASLPFAIFPHHLLAMRFVLAMRRGVAFDWQREPLQESLTYYRLFWL
jgi:hypothetical protein